MEPVAPTGILPENKLRVIIPLKGVTLCGWAANTGIETPRYNENHKTSEPKKSVSEGLKNIRV